MQLYLREEKRTVTPKKATEILAKHGTHISLETAEQMLDFLYKLSNLSVSEAILTVSRQKNGVSPKNRKL
ncbi:hypothetical protein BDD43_2540 [Mucilaginibacter gracilis]|uniref:Uncharacterized protein n=1 Tax=Mucilaginibacter gracilis TaxID=423350 RepID=A0A495J0T6_9SPHI|nr:hypothetical protein [Mucilaginibacter gracilis]RKR82363.1 hypothetical protein BDD43_2540 [Mucilaginibacter gracilis]